MMLNAVKARAASAASAGGASRCALLLIASKPPASSAKLEASVTTRREADNAASSGTITSQIAAKEVMPPVHQAIVETSPVSSTEDSTCALSYHPVCERKY